MSTFYDEQGTFVTTDIIIRDAETKEVLMHTNDHYDPTKNNPRLENSEEDNNAGQSQE